MNPGTPHTAEAHVHHEPGFLGKYVFSTDHKIIGIQFLFSGLIFLFIGGALAMLVRIQLGWPGAQGCIATRLRPWQASIRDPFADLDGDRC